MLYGKGVIYHYHRRHHNHCHHVIFSQGHIANTEPRKVYDENSNNLN